MSDNESLESVVAEAAAPLEEAVGQANGVESAEREVASLEEAAKEMRKRFKLKVDGKEEDFEVDLSNEDELVKQFQLAKVSQKRMAEYAGLKKDVDELAKLLISSPETVLEQLGMDVDKLAEQRIAKRLEELQKSPEQRAKEELERKVRDYEERLSRAEQEKAQESEMRFQQEEASKINNQIEQAISQYPDLPKTPYTLERIARYMIAEMDAGNENVSVEEILPKVKRDADFELKQRLNALSEGDKYDLIEELVGKDLLEKMRKRRLAQNRTSTQTATAVKPTGAAELRPAQNVDKKKVPLKDFLKGLGSR